MISCLNRRFGNEKAKGFRKSVLMRWKEFFQILKTTAFV